MSPSKKKQQGGEVKKEEEGTKSVDDDCSIGSTTGDNVCHQEGQGDKGQGDGKKTSSENKNNKPFFTIVASATE